MIISGVCYLIGAGLTTGAVPRQAGLSMLIIGRIMLGVGVGFANSVSPFLISADFKGVGIIILTSSYLHYNRGTSASQFCNCARLA